MHTPADALPSAINRAASHLIADAVRADPDQWLYASRVLDIRVEDHGHVDVSLSSWMGREGRQMCSMDATVPDDSLHELVATLLGETPSSRVAVIRISRLPQVSADELEVTIDLAEWIFDDPIDVSDPNLGGFSLFGDL